MRSVGKIAILLACIALVASYGAENRHEGFVFNFGGLSPFAAVEALGLGAFGPSNFGHNHGYGYNHPGHYHYTHGHHHEHCDQDDSDIDDNFDSRGHQHGQHNFHGHGRYHNHNSHNFHGHGHGSNHFHNHDGYNNQNENRGKTDFVSFPEATGAIGQHQGTNGNSKNFGVLDVNANGGLNVQTERYEPSTGSSGQGFNNGQQQERVTNTVKNVSSELINSIFNTIDTVNTGVNDSSNKGSTDSSIGATGVFNGGSSAGSEGIFNNFGTQTSSNEKSLGNIDGVTGNQPTDDINDPVGIDIRIGRSLETNVSKRNPRSHGSNKIAIFGVSHTR